MNKFESLEKLFLEKLQYSVDGSRNEVLIFIRINKKEIFRVKVSTSNNTLNIEKTSTQIKPFEEFIENNKEFIIFLSKFYLSGYQYGALMHC